MQLFDIEHYHSPNIKAVMTWEYRKPKKWEYYLSWAHPTAYMALNDLKKAYHIATKVLVKQKVSYEILK